MTDLSDDIRGPYELLLPRDAFLLKHQVRSRSTLQGEFIQVSFLDVYIPNIEYAGQDTVCDCDLDAALERSSVDSEDAGTLLWCLRNCKHISEEEQTLNCDKLINEIILTLKKSDNPEIVAAGLAQVFGYKHLYFISRILDFRRDILNQWHTRLCSLAARLVAKHYGKTEEYQRVDKLVMSKTGRSIEHCKKRLENVLASLLPGDLLQVMDSDTHLNMKSFEKPRFVEKTVTFNVDREDHELYEKFTLPTTKQTTQVKSESLISISTLPEWAQAAFADIEKFNIIQSLVFDTAFNTGYNMLISAPTGCGKTNVALLCVLQNFRAHFESGTSSGKAIYIAPMKALSAEIATKFHKAIASLGLVVTEVTGDTNISKSELDVSDVIITTPEKWDILTRNSNSTGTQSDDSFFSRITCLIIDEIHLLNDDRGPVVETIVARFFRLIESTQIIRRVVGISATLPNWRDVAQFLRVTANNAFYFGPEYRCVPLEQIFYGVKKKDNAGTMLHICYNHIIETVEKGKQCIVFVHSRNETLKTANALIKEIQFNGKGNMFLQSKDSTKFHKNLGRLKFAQLTQLAEHSFAIHHAGLSKHDRDLVESMFKHGFIKVLVSTSTLAWGVNLPAHCVIIKGTFIGGIGVDRNINQLELTQIMGRAGRPQYDTKALGVLITEHKSLHNYLRMQIESIPIESQLHRHLENALNAEIAIGAVKNLFDANAWLQYTYLHVRLAKNPLHYGLNSNTSEQHLYNYRKKIVSAAAENICRSKLIRYCKGTGEFVSTDLGRIAARYYIDYETMHNFAASLNPYIYFDKSIMGTNPGPIVVSDEYILDHLCECKEFENLLVRSEESEELVHLEKDCIYKPRHGLNHVKSKVSILVQAHISRIYIKTPSLIADLNFLVQNVGRYLRAYFEVSMCETVSGPPVGNIIHKWMLMFERQIWDVKFRPINVFRHFCHSYHSLDPKNEIKSSSLLSEATASRLDGVFKLEDVLDLSPDELASIVKSKSEAKKLCTFRRHVPYPSIKTYVQPLTNRIARVTVYMQLENIKWSSRWNGADESFNVWVCSEDRLISPNKATLNPLEPYSNIEVYVPLHGNDTCLTVKIFSCRWLGLVFEEQVMVLATDLKEDGYTALSNLLPLPTNALGNRTYESVYKFKYFNPLQTQVFTQCYLNDGNVLVGSPTGSGKTVAAELGLFRLFNTCSSQKAVYIAPLKALAYERLKDWSRRFGSFKKIVEMTGDVYTTAREIEASDVIITTPEKWDGVSRHWRRRKFVRAIGLIIMDEVHLLGEARGAILESIVVRLGFISRYTGRNIRLICLSTALANPRQIGQWLSIGPSHLFNFSPAVRPVKCNMYIDGFPLKAYCPRMNSMNKPAFDTILRHDPSSPVLVFVSSRRQTRTTAQDFLGLLQMNSTSWAPFTDEGAVEKFGALDYVFQDEYLNQLVPNGIGIHHAGLQEGDRRHVESMFEHGLIKVLIATSTLAWGVNLPAKIVIVKGTEYYDGGSKRYVDYSITDIMQMVGRAGRSLCDKQAYAYIYTETCKVRFYKAFLFSPFPAESHFYEKLLDNINAEIASGTICSKEKALDYIKGTFLYNRLKSNPQYYENIDLLSTCSIKKELSDADEIAQELVDKAFDELINLGCIALFEDVQNDVFTSHMNLVYVPTLLGILSSQYYISAHTIHKFAEEIQQNGRLFLFSIAKIVSDAMEFGMVPLRHNEDCYNMQLSSRAPVPIDELQASSPHGKTFLLLQARMFNLEMPVFDYYNDLKSVMDQIPRVIQAFIDLAACCRSFKTLLYAMLLYKCLVWEINPTSLELPSSESLSLSVQGYISTGDDKGTNVPKKHIDVVLTTKNSDAKTEFVLDTTQHIVDICVAVDGFNASDSSLGYLLLANETTNVIYGFKKVLQNFCKTTFRLKFDTSIQKQVYTRVVFTSNAYVEDLQTLLIFKFL